MYMHTAMQVDGETPKRWCSRGHDKQHVGVSPYTFQVVYFDMSMCMPNMRFYVLLDYILKCYCYCYIII